MQCPCCNEQVVRATALVETRSWIRPGDHYCPPCKWLLPREMAFDDLVALKEWCPEHGSHGATKVHSIAADLD